MDLNTARNFLILMALVLAGVFLVGLRFFRGADRLASKAGREPAWLRRFGLIMMAAAPLMFAFMATMILSGTVHLRGAH